MLSDTRPLLQDDWKPRGAFELPYDRVQTRNVTAHGDPIRDTQLSLLLIGLHATTYPCLEAAVSRTVDSADAASSAAATHTNPPLDPAFVRDYVVGLFDLLRTAHPDPLELVKDAKEKRVLKRTFTLAYHDRPAKR